MKETVVSHRLTLEVLSPLHIGTGDRISGKGYARQDSRIFIADSAKLAARVIANPRVQAAFEAFCLGRDWLSVFLQQHQIRPEEVAAYGVHAVGRFVREIYPFVKLADQRPYVPGSSLKGGVRSALLRAALLQDRNCLAALGKFARERLDELRRLKREQPHNANRHTQRIKRQISEHVENTYFGKDPHHDFLRVLQFSDSQPVDVGRLELAEVKVLSTTSARVLRIKQQKRLDRWFDMILSPEVLRVGTRLEGWVSFEQHLLSPHPPTDKLGFHNHAEAVLNFIAACRRAAQDLLKREIEFYEQFKHDTLNRWCESLLKRPLQNNECLLHFAWGSGFVAKTVTDLFDGGLIEDLRWAFPRMRGKDDTSGGRRMLVQPFPKSRKVYCENGQPKMPLGWVKLSLGEEVKYNA